MLLALAVTLLWGAVSLQEQDDLARKMIRLHVIANSDNEADQTLKLQVRDKVLTLTEDTLRQSADMTDAEVKLTAALPKIQAAAQQEIMARGYDYPVKAELVPASFPTKDYDGFSLPGGDYTALRLTIGEGEGHNWWCVVFPPLCVSAAEQDRALDAMSGDVRGIISDDGGRVIRFRIVELWGELTRLIGVV